MRKELLSTATRFCKKLGVIIISASFLCFSIYGDPFANYHPRVNGNHRPYFDIDRIEPQFFIMSMTQSGLTESKAQQIDSFKKGMLEGTFEYHDFRQVSGLFHEKSHTYFVSEGHHRLAAALEIAKETGDWSYFKKLVQTGYWSKTDQLPPRRYPLTMRTTWSQIIRCRLWLSRLVPSRANLFSK